MADVVRVLSRHVFVGGGRKPAPAHCAARALWPERDGDGLLRCHSGRGPGRGEDDPRRSDREVRCQGHVRPLALHLAELACEYALPYLHKAAYAVSRTPDIIGMTNG